MNKICIILFFVLLMVCPMVQSSAEQLVFPWEHWDSDSFIGNSPYGIIGDKTTPYSCGIAPFGFVQENGLIRIRDTHAVTSFGIGNTRGEVLLPPAVSLD